ncbi:MAG: ABC transporter substrate-binding protein [Desulfovibrionaceae bacterium]|jgi:ABC-type uncharacterized transport system substrate-binding protein|nr:ABC transporter substrate-binding protein [Desulfovibrionaceae bacterium]
MSPPEPRTPSPTDSPAAPKAARSVRAARATCAVALATVALLALCLLVPPPASSQSTSTAPRTRPDGEPWHIAYYEGGTHVEYRSTLEALARGLMDLGWIERAELPGRDARDPSETASLWRWLAARGGRFLRFSDTAYLTGNWDPATRRVARRFLIERLNTRKDIDCIIAMGTWAGQDLATKEHHTPTLILSATDPVAAGAVKSAEDSGFDHVTAWVDPGRFRRQLRVFHELFGFRKLGIAYEDSSTGRSYAALKDVRASAAELGFEVVECHAVAHTVERREAMDALARCHRELAPKIDALYLTVHMGLTPENMPRLMQPLYAHAVPVFAQYNAGEVLYGAQLSLSKDAFREVGAFNARTLAMILNGATPRSLPQTFAAPEKIAINLEAAEKIGWYPSFDVISAADELIQTTRTPSNALAVEE